MPRYRLSLLLLALPLIACERRETPITAEVIPAAPAPPPARPGAPPGAEIGLPRAVNGVLPPGAADKVLPPGGKPVVKLLDAGAAPRSDLSYALVKGASARMVVRVDNAMAMKAGGQALPSTALPRMSMGMDAAAVERNAGGESKVESRLNAVGVEPNGGQQEQMARALRPLLDSLKGLSMTYWVNPKGNVRDVKLNVPPNVPPAAQQIFAGLSQSFESMVTPLPSEPVGVGARWQVISRTAGAGADILQAAVYTLKARDGARVTLEVKLVQLAAGDTIKSPQLPAGMTVRLRGFNSGGDGTTVLDLKSVAPESGTVAMKTSMDLSTPGEKPGTTEESSVDTRTTVQIARP